MGMEVEQRDIRLSKRELTYLKGTNFLPAELARIIADAHTVGKDRYVLHLSREILEQFREAFTLRLARVGFGPDSEPTTEGKMLEDLIDRFFFS